MQQGNATSCPDFAIFAFGGNGDRRKIINDHKCSFGAAVTGHHAYRVNSGNDVCRNCAFHRDRLIFCQILSVFRTQHTGGCPETQRSCQLFSGDDKRSHLPRTQVTGFDAINDRILSDSRLRNGQCSRHQTESHNSDNGECM